MGSLELLRVVDVVVGVLADVSEETIVADGDDTMQARYKRQSRPDCSEQKTLELFFSFDQHFSFDRRLPNVWIRSSGCGLCMWLGCLPV